MLKFHKLELQNFQSYGNNLTQLNLDLAKPHLIIGRNYDDIVDGQVDSNGAGKSTILNAICFAAYDDTLTKMSKDKLINYINQKNMCVALVFEKDGMFYRVERFRKHKAKGGDGVKLFAAKTLSQVFDGADKELDITLDSIANTNAKIEKIIGIPFAVFARIVVFNSRYESFLSLPASHASKDNQRQILEELFGYTEISEKADKLKDLIKIDKQQLAYLTETYNRTLEEIDRQEAKIASVQQMVDKWDAQHAADLKQIKLEIKQLMKIDFEEEAKRLADLANAEDMIARATSKKNSIVNTLKMVAKSKRDIEEWNENHHTKISQLKSKLASTSVIDVDGIRAYHDGIKTIENNIANLYTALRNEEQALKRSTASAGAISAEIEHLSDSTCPFCKQHFAESKNILQEKNIELSGLRTTIEALESSVTEIETSIKTLQKKLDEATTKNPGITIREAEEINASIAKLQAQLEMELQATNPHTIIEVPDDSYNEGAILELEDEINRYKSLIQNGSDGVFETVQELNLQMKNLEKLTFKYDDLKESVNPYESVLEELVQGKLEKPDSTQIDELVDSIEHKDFLLKLLTKKDSFIRKALLNKNLPLLNTRLSQYLAELGLSHKVTFNEDMTATISRYDDLPYENLSAGQTARLNIALSFAFRDVLEARFGRINFCILDEFLDNGLGNVGVNLATKLVKKITKANGLSTIVISHKDEVQNFFEEKIEVELRNGFSTIVRGAI